MTKKPKILNGEMIVYSMNVAGKTGLPLAKNKLDSYLTPLIKIISKWIKDLNIRFETVKLKENREKKKPTLVLAANFCTQKVQAIKAKINKQDYIKLRSFCTFQFCKVKSEKKINTI